MLLFPSLKPMLSTHFFLISTTTPIPCHRVYHPPLLSHVSLTSYTPLISSLIYSLVSSLTLPQVLMASPAPRCLDLLLPESPPLNQNLQLFNLHKHMKTAMWFFFLILPTLNISQLYSTQFSSLHYQQTPRASYLQLLSYILPYHLPPFPIDTLPNLLLINHDFVYILPPVPPPLPSYFPPSLPPLITASSLFLIP